MEMENKKLRDVAEIARQIMVGEELKGGQKKLDKNHNNKIDGQDLAILRAQKEEVETVEESQMPAAKGARPEPKRQEKVVVKPAAASPGETVLSREEVEQIDELSTGALKSYIKGAKEDKAAHQDQKDSAAAADDHKTASDSAQVVAKRQAGIKAAKAKLNAEEIDQAAATILEYESKDGKFVHRARPGVYGGTKDEKHAVDTLSGPKAKELKAIESEKKKKKFSEDLDLYKEQGIKGLFEAWGKKKAAMKEAEEAQSEEVISEEPTSAEFDAQLADAKQRAAGTKKQAEVSKPAVQAVQNEETHTTVQVIDFDPINGVQHSEIDLEERHLTEPETKKKEEIVKSMKKGIAGFKDRYGDRAKEVMYATATARAKGD